MNPLESENQKDLEQSVAQKTKIAVIDLLANQSYRVSIGHSIATGLEAMWLARVVEATELVFWVAAVALLSVLRIVIFHAYSRIPRKNRHANWLYIWCALTAFDGIANAFAFAYFVPLELPEYAVTVGLFVTALSAAAIIAYGSSLLCILSFFVPVAATSCVILVIEGSEAALYTGIALILYSIVVLSMLKSLNTSLKKSISLNFYNQYEIEKRKLVEDQLQEISRRDSLTGLFNRRYFDEVLAEEIGRARRNKTSLCLLLFDIDFFKQYNDYYGHVAGDACLVKVADVTSSVANRNGDLLARYGGEEFAIILPSVDIEGAEAFANKLRLAILNENIAHESSGLKQLKSISVSVGVTSLPKRADVEPVDLINQADKALYEAKELGRNCVFAHRENESVDAS